MDAKEMVKLAIKALEDKKGEDIRIIDIRQVSVLADYFIIASGSNANQVQAMTDNVEEVMGKAGHEPRQIEGYRSANWILMDYGDIIMCFVEKIACSMIWSGSGETERLWKQESLKNRNKLIVSCRPA